MRGFQVLFEEYGADYQITMSRFLNNKGMYLRLFGMLFQDETPVKLGEALDAGNLSGAFEAAHTLKGVVGNLGLTPLYETLCAIVEPLRAREKRDDYPELYGEIQLEFQRARVFWEELKGVGQI